ncbi:phosphoesterase family-domain-containing protein [Russula dissimulans]|nr:phosphoesterase family-domain-containing protein [Russula dissimulans]
MYLPSSLLLLPVVLAAQALIQLPQFVPPSEGPLVESSNYVGANNGSLPKPQIVSGKAFDRVMIIWLENTDYASASTTNTFLQLAEQGILLDQYYAVTHPSEPNYVAAVSGDFYGMADDNLYNIPSNISTVVDLLEDKSITWASYQENLPTDGFEGFNFTSKNYVNTSSPDYTFYVRKHNGLIVHDSVASVASRRALIRNFNDFAVDVNASSLPQWIWVTPNMVDDGHDTTIDYAASWVEYWLNPLLNNSYVNDERTLIVVSFDESETYTENNQILTLLLGGAIPQSARNTTDSTYYTHYSLLSTVQANWGLKSLGRGDTNKTLSNVYSFVAQATGYTNTNASGANIPLTNATGTIPGALNANIYVPFTAPDISAVGAGGGSVFIAPGLNTSFTTAVAPAPVNLTAQNKTVPWAGARNGSLAVSTSNSSSSGSGSGKSGVTNMREGVVRAAIFGAVLASVAVVLA